MGETNDQFADRMRVKRGDTTYDEMIHEHAERIGAHIGRALKGTNLFYVSVGNLQALLDRDPRCEGAKIVGKYDSDERNAVKVETDLAEFGVNIKYEKQR